ncbi:hypothetical protein N0V90_013018 [Kalmusia sp. IMI 367209]|nr:hypothetical protein N0V90_013018 [Kalmusia sp. IMI 367209]
MFSDEDVLEIYRLSPPREEFRTEKSKFLPLLIETVSGRGFITERKLNQDFTHVVTTGTARLALPTMSSDLDVDVNILLQLVRSNYDLALLSNDENSIVPQQEREAIIKSLQELLATQIVTKTEFAHLHSIHPSSVESLVRIPYIQQSLEEEVDDYLLSKSYSRALSSSISQKLEKELNSVKTIELTPQSLPGTPPIWLIRQYIHILTGRADLVSLFHIEEKDDTIRCTPKKSILSKRDEVIAQLQSGEIFSLERTTFSRDFEAAYASSEELEEHLSGCLSIGIIGDFVVSTERLSRAAGEGVLRLDEQGYIRLSSIYPSETPHRIQEEVQERIAQIIMLTCSGRGMDVRRIEDFICTDTKYSTQRKALLDIAKAQAVRHWNLLKGAPDKEVKFQITELLTSIPAEDHLLRAIAQQKDFESVAAEQFSAEIADLEIKNESDFSMFWTERVTARVQNYTEGLKFVEDSKLHDQLADLLSSYVQKEFVLDMVSKARAQGLICSKRTRKNISRFEATLKTSKSDLASVLSILEKFDKKQGVSEVGPSSAEEVKKTLIQDMLRRMQKPKTDAPLMFLSLVIVLSAKHYPGVIYATGKFAPKLLKQLKSRLDGDDYERVEKWKELAKAGTLTKEDRSAMARMAEHTSS